MNGGRPKTVFVTGTDTGVGKTTVACALLVAWRRRGLRVAAFKPIETGCASGPDGYVAADAIRLGTAAAASASLDTLCPNRYATPVSPEAAATIERRPVNLDAIDAAHARLVAESPAAVLVEGAGGLLVPIGDGLFMSDLARRLGATVVIVARASLGTVNHSLLTIAAARARGLPIAGIILNRVIATAGPDEPTNAPAIAHHGSVPVFGTLPHAPEAALDALADLAEAHLDLKGLWQAF